MPYLAILVHAVSIVVVASVGSFAVLVPFASVAVLVLYLAVSLASWELQRRDVRAASEVFSVPLVVLLSRRRSASGCSGTRSRTELLLEGIVMAAATALYVVRRFTSTRS